MPNAIKYNTSAETLALKKGNFWIGTGDVSKGPTSSTGFYNGITPPTGGYTIYLNKETGGPSIYTVTTEAQMVSLTNTIGAQSFTTSGQCLNWFATQTDKMIFNIDYPAIVTNGLVLNLDAGFTPSYSRSGTTWYDVSLSGNNGVLTNGPTFNSDNGGSIVFDGTNDYVGIPDNGTGDITEKLTICSVIKSNGNWIQYGGILEKKNSYEFTMQSSGVMEFGINIGGGSFSEVLGSGTLSQNTWHHVSMTFSTDLNQVKFYLNGVLDVTRTLTANITTNNEPINVGASIGGAPQYFRGNIALTQLYNRALSDTEVLQNYNATKGRFGL
jgi:hypothetical protein